MKRFLMCIVILIMLVGSLTGASLAQDEEIIEITIINTSDEHGWIEPFTPYRSDTTYGGAEMIFAWWVAREGYDPADDSYLLLSGGDNWTGPPISTWFDGAPMVELMNWMGYDASVVGNHEYDFGREALNKRIAEADFAYLSANTRFADSGEQVDFAEPYVILDVAGLKVGVIGLTTLSTPTSTHPKNITDLTFLDYAETLEEVVPIVREEGADIILVNSHACMYELAEVAEALTVEVDAMFAGHCHEMDIEEAAGIPILGSGWAWRSYARLTLEFDTTEGAVVSYDADVVSVEYPSVRANNDVLALVGPWQDKVDAELGTEIGYLDAEMERQSWLQSNFVTDAWLWAYPSADVAITNFGGLRQEISAGTFTVGSIVGVLPFQNRIVEVKVTGAQLAENLANSGGAVGGISYIMKLDGEEITEFDRHADPDPNMEIEITFLDGREFNPDAVYSVLINDFMYTGGDGYLFGEQDPNGYDTSIQWRQPVIDWALFLATSESDPLENYLDAEPRGPNQ